MAAWSQARLIKYLDGKLELLGGSKEDRLAAHEWISLFRHEAVHNFQLTVQKIGVLYTRKVSRLCV
jgi:hypothetical protein